MKVEYLVDMHTHSRHSHDSSCPVAEMALCQRAQGIRAFAVTDHFDPLEYGEKDIFRWIRDSVTEARETKVEGIKILTGVELGEGDFDREITERIVHMCDYDVVIGSIHTIPYKQYAGKPYSGIDFSAMPRQEVLEYLEAYFDQMLQMLEVTPCDIMAHLTCPLRYIVGKYGIGIDIMRYRQKIESILRCIIARGIAMEINTSGIHDRYGDFMPTENIVKWFRELGGYLVTLGSDAHTSERAANGFAEALAMLERNGFQNVYYYEKRQAKACVISGHDESSA